MLSNIVFIIILILLIIILVLLYFFSNDIRKNKNKLNICDSDINSIRERLVALNQKVSSLENSLTNDMGRKKSGQNFSNILEQLGSMNNNFMNGGIDIEDYEEESDDNTEVEEEEDDEEVEDDEEAEDDEEEAEDEEEEAEDDEAEDDEAEDDVIVEEIEITVESEESESKPVEKEVVQEPVVEEVIQDSKKKTPSKDPSKLDIGVTEFSPNGNTKYSVQLNKSGKKYWKKI